MIKSYVSTVAILIAGAIYFVTVDTPLINISLVTYYTFLCSVVFISCMVTRSNDLWLLGVILILRFMLENAAYPHWNDIGLLFMGHSILAVSAFLVAFNRKELLIFPVLILAQAASDIYGMSGSQFVYKNVHNILAIIQMAVYPVIVWQTKEKMSKKGILESLMMYIANRSRQYEKTNTI